MLLLYFLGVSLGVSHHCENTTCWHPDICALSPYFSCTQRSPGSERERDREGLHPDLFWIERGWHPVCPTICVMFLASHQALLSGNSARRLMCAGGAAEYSANSAQQIWILCHMTAPTEAEKPQRVTARFNLVNTKTHLQKGQTPSHLYLIWKHVPADLERHHPDD